MSVMTRHGTHPRLIDAAPARPMMCGRMLQRDAATA